MMNPTIEDLECAQRILIELDHYTPNEDLRSANLDAIATLVMAHREAASRNASSRIASPITPSGDSRAGD